MYASKTVLDTSNEDEKQMLGAKALNKKSFDIRNIDFKKAMQTDEEGENNRLFVEGTANSSKNNEFQYPKGKKITKLHHMETNTSQPVKTTNKFGILNQTTTEDEMSDNTNNQQNVTNNKRKWIPPIIVADPIINYAEFMSDLQEILGHNNFNVKYRRTNSQITTVNMEDRKKIIKAFQDNGIHGHSYTPEEEKVKKIVMKGAPNMDIGKLKQDIEDQGPKIENITYLKTKRGDESFSYLITVKKEVNLQNIRKIGQIENLNLKWEKYNRKNNYTQCHRCQRFGHAENNCNMTPRCVKCPQMHHWKQCTLKKTENTTAFCHNCNGKHAATYKKCPILLEYLEKRNNTAAQKFVGNRGNIKSNTNVNTTKPSTSTHTFVNNTNSQQNQNSNKSMGAGMKYSYREMASGVYHGDLDNNQNNNNENSNVNETSNTNEFGEIISLILLMKKLKEEMRHCKDKYEKINIIARYIDQI